MSDKKRFFTEHARSSAALVSIGIHAVLIIMAFSFVAVRVIQKRDTSFEAKPVSRPRMQLKKLQVPINIKKKRTQPKLRKRIVVQPKMDQNVPDIKLPEVSGIKGGIGGAAGGLGTGSGIGFSMPEIELFGIKSKGEKVCIILDSSPEMMYDEMGGIRAYSIIKSELIRILEGLPATALFNVIVYGSGDTHVLFPQMVSANSAHTAQVHEWLEPLNAVRPGMGSREYGVETLGPGGARNREDFLAGRIQRQRAWYHPVMLAMKQQADAIFLLTCDWGSQWHVVSGRDENWSGSRAERRWNEAVEESKRLLEEENRKRAEKGEPPRVLSGSRDLVAAYFPNVQQPPPVGKDRYGPKDFTEAMLEIRERYRPRETRMASGIKKNRKSDEFSFNVIYFRKAGSSGIHEGFSQLTRMCDGDYETIAGLEAIESYVVASPGTE